VRSALWTIRLSRATAARCVEAVEGQVTVQKGQRLRLGVPLRLILGAFESTIIVEVGTTPSIDSSGPKLCFARRPSLNLRRFIRAAKIALRGLAAWSESSYGRRSRVSPVSRWPASCSSVFQRALSCHGSRTVSDSGSFSASSASSSRQAAGNLSS